MPRGKGKDNLTKFHGLGTALMQMRRQQRRTMKDVAAVAGITVVGPLEADATGIALRTLDKWLTSLDKTPAELVTAVRLEQGEDLLHDDLLKDLGLGDVPDSTQQSVMSLLRTLRDWQDDLLD